MHVRPELRSEPRWERRKEARPQELIRAGLDLFVERGYAATRLEDVAARAGVSKGTLYLYFDGKDALFKAAVRSSLIPVIAQAEQVVEHYAGPTDELFRIVVRGWRAATEDSPVGGLAKLMVAEAGNFPDLARWYHAEAIERAHRLTARIIARGIERGEFREVDVDYAIHVVVAPLVMMDIARHSFAPCTPNDLDPGRYIDTYLDLVLAGLRKVESS